LRWEKVLLERTRRLSPQARDRMEAIFEEIEKQNALMQTVTTRMRQGTEMLNLIRYNFPTENQHIHSQLECIAEDLYKSPDVAEEPFSAWLNKHAALYFYHTLKNDYEKAFESAL